MNRKTFFLFCLISFAPVCSFGQSDFYSQICAKTDKIVIELTNQEYFDHLRRDSVPIEANFVSVSDPDGCAQKTYTVFYYLKNPNDFQDMYVLDAGTLSRAGMHVELDNNLEPFEPTKRSVKSRAEKQLAAYNRFKSAELITKEEAEHLSEMYFPDKFKKNFTGILIYDSGSDSFLWQFEKFKGFRKVTIEEVNINAETGKFEKKNSHQYRRSFWRALFDPM